MLLITRPHPFLQSRRGIMMNLASTGALLISAMVATSAMGTVTTTVVDVPTRGVTQRFLYLHPDAPAANIVSLPGGDGILGIQNDGTMTTFVAQCSPVGRTRQAFADHGFAVALVDAASDGSVYDFSDVLDNVPTWVIGGSAATAAIWTLANHLPTDAPVGAIFWSPGSPVISQVALIRRPTFVIYHQLDTGQSGSAFFAALTSAPVREQVSFTGGSNAGCGYHLFNGLDAEFVAATTGFIDKYNGTLGAASSQNIGPGFTGAWYDPAQSGHGLFLEVLQNNGVLAWWFTFNPAGTEQSWFGGVGNYSGNTAVITQVTQTTSGRWIPNFDPSKLVQIPWGTLTFSFTDCNHGKVDFNSSVPGYGIGSMNLTRLTLPAGLTCP